MSFNPNWLISPSKLLLFLIEIKNIDKIDLINNTSISEYTLNNILEGKILIDKEICNSLSSFFNLPENFWIDKQKSYQSKREESNSINSKIWLKNFPTKYLSQYFNLNHDIDSYLSFFKVNNIYEWDLKYKSQNKILFRKSDKLQSEQFHIVSWLRSAEIFSEKIKCNSFNKTLFENYLNNDIKSLTRSSNPDFFITELVKLCSECGVRLIVLPTPEKCSVFGASKKYNDNPLIVLSFRYLSDDQFWFTFYHEAGHVILHDLSTPKIESIEKSGVDNENEEIEANLFAKEMLIPYEYRDDLRKLHSNKRKIILLSQKLNISPGIIIGQMQHSEIINYKYLNSYKRRFTKEQISNAMFKALEI